MHDHDEKGASPAEVRAARKEMQRLERQMSKITAQQEKVHAQMAEQATDHQAVLELDAKLRALTTEQETLEEAWLAAAEQAG